jgi:hypothetical protein
MQLLASWSIEHNGEEKTIELLQGDLSRLPPEYAVDIVVVSAFADDYLPTPNSLIGALYRAGLSVADLAERKAVDMRAQFSSWLSQPVPKQFPFRRVLCIESGWRGSPPEITDDLFRSLAPYLLTECPNASVAMPLIGAGDQGWPPEKTVESILRAAVSWIQRGLPLRLLKIVVHSQAHSRIALEGFSSIRRELGEQKRERTLGFIPAVNSQEQEPRAEPRQEPQAEPRQEPQAEPRQEPQAGYDVFLSYCHEDSETATIVKEELERLRPGVRIFFDRATLQAGASWLLQIAESLDGSRRVAALYTPHYWGSSYCKDEFTAALARQNDTRDAVLFPMYVLTAQVPYLFRNIQYADCREGDKTKLTQACFQLAQML